MKVRVFYSIEISEKYRTAVNAFNGLPGMADREDMKEWFETYGNSMDSELAHSYGGEAPARPLRRLDKS